MTCKKSSMLLLKKRVENFTKRVNLAETKLRLISAIPKDSRGWMDFRQREARKALREILDEYEREIK